MNEQFAVLLREGDEEGKPYPIADRTPNRARALRKLQATTSYYDDTERYDLIKEMLWTDEYVASEEEVKDAQGQPTGNVRYKLKPPTLNPYDFLDKAAELLFPLAPVAANQEHLNYDEVIRGLDFFSSRIAPKRRMRGGFFG